MLRITISLVTNQVIGISATYPKHNQWSRKIIGSNIVKKEPVLDEFPTFFSFSCYESQSILGLNKNILDENTTFNPDSFGATLNP